MTPHLFNTCRKFLYLLPVATSLWTATGVWTDRPPTPLGLHPCLPTALRLLLLADVVRDTGRAIDHPDGRSSGGCGLNGMTADFWEEVDR